MADGIEPITDDEIVYRRIPASQNWYDPKLNAPPSFRAFRPNEKRDATGLSMERARYTTPCACAENDRGKFYYIAVLRVGDLRKAGIKVVPKTDPPHGPGHVELPDIRSSNRKETEEQQLVLAEKLCLRVEGPFPEPESQD